MRRHPPAQAPAEACSAFGPIARVEGEMREVDPAVSGLCEVDPAVSGLYEVGPAETGLARSASCRSESLGRAERLERSNEGGGFRRLAVQTAFKRRSNGIQTFGPT